MDIDILPFSPVMPFSLKFQSNVMFELLPSFLSQSLDDAHKNYTQMKAKLLAAETIPNDRSYRAISDSLVTDISRYVQCEVHFFSHKMRNVSLCFNNQLTTTQKWWKQIMTHSTQMKHNHYPALFDCQIGFAPLSIRFLHVVICFLFYSSNNLY